MKLQDLLEAKYAQGPDAALQKLRSAYSNKYGSATALGEPDWDDDDDEPEREAHEYGPEDLITLDQDRGKSRILIALGCSFYPDESDDYAEHERHQQLEFWMKKAGFESEEDYFFGYGYGDDVANHLSIYNLDILKDEKLFNMIVDVVGVGCYHAE